MMTNADPAYDRASEVKQFDDSKIGVRGLVESGITTIPRFFVHPSDTLPRPSGPTTALPYEIPVVDLSGVNSDRRSIIIDQVRAASSKLGFFQVTNHGIPTDVLHRTVAAIKAFNELPAETKPQYYHRDMSSGVSFSTNFDLFQSKAASWRDTLQVRLGPTPADFEALPEVCRTEVTKWDQHIQRLGETLMEILSEGLGLERGTLKELSCLEARVMAAHYYPYCPQPDLTFGITSHTDPGALTVVLQNHIGGLQVKNGGDWVDIKPVDGALVINVGDILQILTNDEYRSVEHRVLANPFRDPRVSIAIFFNPSKRGNLFGPLPELVSEEKPALYRPFQFSEFMRRFFTKELDGKSLINYFRLSETEDQIGE
ncbi:PREDICTED: 1-aminocyclopropane-1-carboxylate oxidase homolog 1-like [Nelumbo nucifera]|uniref:Fe2OG dioxygenase domain-containing protein n=2 Tax=Nelumbo nucifera TaxID=4432 RepID=A0A822YYE7_NELNU|nr:PREDICTED: 1-aminocyclopropane-1-carboxylate oxidase homolog 1-like [Nelumbo nucifera]DAD35756.1 TPA_asm: hypothetical protein HUJ06_006396 [Nelumbo nucifera]